MGLLSLRFLECLLGHKLNLDLKWILKRYLEPTILLASLAIELIYRFQVPLQYLTPAHPWLFFTRASLYEEWSIAGISRLEPPIPHLLVLRALVDDGLFSTIFHNRFLHRRNVASLSPLYRYIHGKYFDELHYLVPPDLTFTAKTHHGSNPSHSLRIPLGKRKLLSKNFLLTSATRVTDSREDVSMITTILTISTLGLTVLSPT